MSTFIYDKARKSFLDGDFTLLTSNIKAVLVDAGQYSASQANDQFLSDIASGARLATSSNLANKSTTAGVFDADDISFASVPNTSYEAVVLYVDTGTASTSRLICYIDNAGGLPGQINVGTVNVVWDNGSNKIFKI